MRIFFFSSPLNFFVLYSSLPTCTSAALPLPTTPSLLISLILHSLAPSHTFLTKYTTQSFQTVNCEQINWTVLPSATTKESLNLSPVDFVLYTQCLYRDYQTTPWGNSSTKALFMNITPATFFLYSGWHLQKLRQSTSSLDFICAICPLSSDEFK